MEKTKKQAIMERFFYTADEIIEKPFNWAQMWRLLSYVKPYRKNILPLSFLMVIIGTAVRLLIPILIGVYVLDHAISRQNPKLLLQLILIISGLYVINYAANILRIRWMNQLGQHVIYDLRQHLFTHVQRLSHRFFDQRSAGSILVRIMNDINSLQELFTSGVINLLTDLLLLLGIVVILFTLSPELTIAIMITLPIMFFISTSLRRKIRRSWQMVRLKQSKLNSHLNESIQGIRVTQAYTQEQENMAYFDGVNHENYQSWRDATRKNAMFRPLVELTNAAGTAVLIWYGATLIMNGTVTIGIFVSFAFYLGMFWEPISRLGQVYNQLLMGMASSERIFEFLDEQPSVKEIENAIHIKKLKGDVEFEDVEFSYDHKRKALHTVSFSIPAGTTLALVGHTGSGKTTIANLISRFYDATGGTIKIDGIPITDMSLSSLRSQISIVLQDTFIFSGTIMENIRFGRPNAADQEVIKAAKAVGADDFISRLAMGYKTEVEERGSALSAGQRQLISFARALLADPAILILDEATASIDTETEVKIQQALKTLLHGRTAVMIAHRLSTIRDADRIIVLDHGKKIEEGSHKQLMNKAGIYSGLVKAQYSVS
ncbi:ABC transporter ATP-binding protein [Bacillus atrophaeus]|uniref:ABC transporter ATP-binding protein n=2 Tax=Bacillus atrophaeus TaxID=1452 RepID=A0ABN3Z7Y0_BACA1|nr:ABC transporter ATP-binding protein [Bacillus atrophaeus]AMR63141.1 multidrug ABC transporter ATP-binding protein [Bacillus subtilis subsp. globigii]ADP31940.1 putative ABC transporter ATP-binding protein [Bacillus atrophaeus 1942]AIK46795.1 ABC transporter family protein [Bacillus atrophaeus subsp. globigii]EIM10353.1 putative ABC transporter ATP-binding protein [Bacillus atrophaeus C89]KFK82288.1 ABC transporter family protein [Bacillus atrophaeus]